MLFRALLALLACAVAPRLLAYSFTGTKWNSSGTTLQLQLGASTTPLADGSASWGASAENALALWNSYLASFRFSIVRDSTATRARGNRINNVHFAPDVYGEAWGSGVLAVTLTFSSGASNTETDVIFNNRLNWDSYRGPQRSSNGQPVYDFHRVALHEFGHALGLDHPDENGQGVSALMNSRISSLDTLTADDIAGAQALYGTATAPPPTVAAPAIITQPTSRTVTAGQSTTFNVTATGTAPLSYQWFKSGAPLGGATASNYTLASVTTSDAGNYTVSVSNSAGSVTSNVASLTVNAPPPVVVNPPPPTVTPPTILVPPFDRSISPGAAFTLTVVANGSTPLTYQWRKDGATLPGATVATYTVASATTNHGGSYVVTVSNSAGSVTSASAQIVVGTAPTFTVQPASQSLAAGARLSLNVAASGSPAPSFQWFKNDAVIAGATGASYTTDAAQSSDAGRYHATATNALGTTRSEVATITIVAAPTITTQPVAQTVNAGERVSLSVVASSTPAAAYQWFKDGGEIPGATAATLTLDVARASDNGTYTVRVTNSVGSVTSAGAVLTVRFSRLVNLSTRAFVPTGSALTPGFYIRGTGTKSLLLRAVGPSLSTFGVGSALGEARLQLIAQDTATVIASNSDWGGSSTLRNTFATVGAFPLASDSKDAAVQADLTARGYTARIVGGDASMAGITLAEIYDADPAGSSTQLVNVSTLGFVGTGENVLTAGFVIAGNAPKRLLLRAVGPGLNAFGVADALPDPQLGLVPLGGTEPLATNDDWPDLPALRSAFTNAGAFPLTAGSKDAALVITLEPGAYTVVVSSVNGTTAGNALVEIYDLDP